MGFEFPDLNRGVPIFLECGISGSHTQPKARTRHHSNVVWVGFLPSCLFWYMPWYLKLVSHFFFEIQQYFVLPFWWLMAPCLPQHVCSVMCWAQRSTKYQLFSYQNLLCLLWVCFLCTTQNIGGIESNASFGAPWGSTTSSVLFLCETATLGTFQRQGEMLWA